MSARDDREARLRAVILAERDEAYADAFRAGLNAIDTLARYTAGTRAISKSAVVNLRTAIGQLLSSARSAEDGGLISRACAEQIAVQARSALNVLFVDLRAHTSETAT